MDRENIPASHEGHAQHAGRRIAWHIVGAAVALFVAAVAIPLAWAGATANYQARVEREQSQLQMLANPLQPRPTDSSFVFLGSWNGEVLP